MTNPSQRTPQWRVGSKVLINVYDGDRPVCQCQTADDARRIVAAVNSRYVEQRTPERERALDIAQRVRTSHMDTVEAKLVADALLASESEHAAQREEIQRLRAALGRISTVGVYCEGTDEFPVTPGYLREMARKALAASDQPANPTVMDSLRVADQPNKPNPPSENWVIKFEDPDKDDISFTGAGAEDAARRTFRSVGDQWPCRLFTEVASTGCVPISDQPKCGTCGGTKKAKLYNGCWQHKNAGVYTQSDKLFCYQCGHAVQMRPCPDCRPETKETK